MSESIETYRRRRLLALAGLACVVLACVLAVRSCGGGQAEGTGGDAQPAEAAVSNAALPGGGRRIFPDYRVVGFYGAPQDRQLGALGIGTPDEAAARLRRVARDYERKARPVLPAFELIATIAADSPGDDGLYRMHQSDEVIGRYLDAARRAKALLLLDIQPGRGDFLSEAQRLERWLREPDVGIALDPEWHVGPGEIPGKVIGSVTAEQVNEVSAYVSAFVTDHDLPDKLFVVHQFTSSMISDKQRVEQRLGLALTMNVDGFGDRSNKESKYDLFTSELTRFHNGFKLFYEEDTNLMSPQQVLALRPPPDLVVYE
ncbi:MAG: hypothetical protein QOI64_1010 [Solirubrobacteraceae bacterium]|jgi:hypothetical protein|nr:hypothetical protein [Solirubrobacteraceae bacterium]